MTKDLVLYEPPCIRVVLPGPGGCEFSDCDNKDTHVVFWVSKDWKQLHNNLICARDAFLLKGKPSTMVFPQKYAPPQEWVLARVNEELARRRPPVMHYQMNFGTTGTTTFNFGSTGGIYYQ